MCNLRKYTRSNDVGKAECGTVLSTKIQSYPKHRGHCAVKLGQSRGRWVNLPNRYSRRAEGLWRMRRHGPVIAHCTDSVVFPAAVLNECPIMCSLQFVFLSVLSEYWYNADLRIKQRVKCSSLASVAHWALTNHASVTLRSWKNVVCFNLLALCLYYFCNDGE